jgi:5-methyltetrahydropteroyltriglutamate--homocysteine methyltransferase
MGSLLLCIELTEIQSKKNSYPQVFSMLTANLSGYPKRPDLNAIRKYLGVGGENPFTTSIKKAVQSQMEAKIDIVTDGQIRDPFSLIASNVKGMEPDGYVRIESKLGEPRRPMLALDFLTAAECSDATLVKAVLPGPFSFAKSCQVTAKSPYSSNFDVDLLFDIASIIRFEIEALKENNARLIQIVEPIESVSDIDIFLEMLSFVFKRVKTPICHLEGDIRLAFPQLLDAKISVISFDVVAFPQNREILKFEELFEVHEKIISLGCVDSSAAKKDSVESIERRVIAFVDAFGYENVWISPNKTLASLSQRTACQKLKHLAIAKNRIAARMT